MTSKQENKARKLLCRGGFTYGEIYQEVFGETPKFVVMGDVIKYDELSNERMGRIVVLSICGKKFS